MTGSQPRGQRRRAALLQAAVALLAEGGFAAVTHRAVAQRADLPLAATTYYFASRDQLLTEAFADLVAAELANLRAWVARHGLTGFPHHDDRAAQLGLWELYVHAGRDPALQAIARQWTDGCLDTVATALDLPATHPRVRQAYALLSALWLEILVEEREGGREELRALLENVSRPI